MSKTRVISITRPPSGLVLLGSLALASASLVSVSAVQAQGSPSASAATEPAPAESLAADAAASGIDGNWTLDTEIGDFADYSSSWVGFRVAEVLQQIGGSEAVGRTPSVEGSLVASGSTIGSAMIEVDLTSITSDQSRRDPAIQRALETGDLPTATLASRAPVDLGAVPVDGEAFTATVPTRLTIHGVSQDVDVELTGQRVGDVVVVVGTLPLDFTTFGITMPTAPIVLSVVDTADLEFQLFFRREAASSEEATAAE